MLVVLLALSSQSALFRPQYGGVRPRGQRGMRPAVCMCDATGTDDTAELRAEVARLREALRAEGHRSEPDDHLAPAP